MAAKRFGQFITNVTGTSKQIPRVKQDESGFEFVDQASIPAYTITNVSTDRAYNAADTTLDEISNVLGTLLADLQTAGLTAGANGVQAFQWTTSEQVYPFEKADDGSTLYAIQLTAGVLTGSDTYVSLPAEITAGSKVVKYDAYAFSASTGGFDLRVLPLNGSPAGGVSGSAVMTHQFYFHIDSYTLSQGITDSWVKFLYKH